MLVCRLRAIKQALLNVGERSPAEVLSYVLDAVRAADAKLIGAPAATH
jgi:hypothetical protein